MRSIIIAAFLLLAGCATSLMSREPVSQTVTFAEAPDLAYARAIRAMTRLGGDVTQMNAQTRFLSGRVHGTVLLTVNVQPVAEGASVEVIGTLIPGKVVLGSMDEVQNYVALLR